MNDMLRNDLAERTLLASMFASPEVFGSITELVEPHDFFEPRNELIYGMMYKLYGEGKPFDPVSVAGELQRSGQLQKAGGTEYLQDIINPNNLTSYNADPIGYAALVREASRRRDLSKAGEAIHQAAAGGDGLSADDALIVAENRITEIINKEAASETLRVLHDLIPEAFQDYRNNAEMPEGAVRGIPTGLQQLDDWTTGFQPGQMIIIAARPGIGKTSDIKTPILTTEGWKTLGDIKDGDYVFNPAGKPVKVIKAHKPELVDAYSVAFSDKQEIVVGPEHLWFTTTHRSRKDKTNSAQRTIVLTQDKIDILQTELALTKERDTFSLLDLAKLVGWLSPNQTMIRVADHLQSKVRFIAREATMSYASNHIENHLERLDCQIDTEVHRKVVAIAQQEPEKYFTVKELADKLFPSEEIETGQSYLHELLYKKVNADIKNVTVHISPKKPVLLYNKKELLEAYLRQATGFLNNQHSEESEASVKTTLEIMNTLSIKTDHDHRARHNHTVPAAQPLQITEDIELPVQPYSLGAWLGDGFPASHNVYEIVKEHGSRKHIPDIYFSASITQRKALLAGLMDTDGITEANSTYVQFTNTNERLVKDVVKLASTLGYIPKVTSHTSSKTDEGKDERVAWNVTWATNDGTFSLPRKIAAHREGLAKTAQQINTNNRYIVDVVPLNEKRWMRCLTVDSPDELFLIGETLIPTHNSTLAVDFGRAASFLAGRTVMMFSLEMSDKEVVNRILSAEANVRLHDMKKGSLTEFDWGQLEEAKERINKSGGTFLVDGNPKASVSRIRSVAQRQKLKPEGLDMIIIDYLQLMESGPIRAGMNRENIVSEMSRGIKLLAKELGVPIIVLAQLNRKSEERTDTRPQVSDLRESGSLEQDADIIFLIHRPEVGDSNNRPGEADLILGKHRGGPTGKIPLVSMLEFSKFVPGAGTIAREPEMLGDGQGGEYETTPDEIPW